MPRFRLSPLVPWLLVALAARSEALTNVRYENWFFLSGGIIAHDVVAPHDTVTSVEVSFDATSTAADLSGGFRFSIAERDPGTDQVLARFVIGPCQSLPAFGSEIYVRTYVALYCDAAGSLHVRDAGGPYVTWCAYPNEQVCSFEGNFPAAALPSASEPERFELVVLDENDQEGPHPMAEDALACSGGPLGPALATAAPIIRELDEAPRDYPRSGSIGIFTDAGGTRCSDRIQPLVPFKWYVVARLDGLTRCGITVLELGIHGLPPGFFISTTPNPDAFFVSGNPFTMAGLGFDCERGPGDAIVLYTLDGISNVAVQDLVLEVGAGSPPSNSDTPYPWAQICPIFAGPRRHMDGLPFVVNPSQPLACDTTIPVTSSTWGRLKSLYRNP
jgi:hypothetical protein